MFRTNGYWSRSAITMASLFYAGALCPAAPQDVAAGRVAYHYVGRVTLDLMACKATVIGYFRHIAGIPETVPLFRGAASEATAYFTFRADVDLTPIAGNGDLGNQMFAVAPALIKAGDFSVNPS